MASLSLFPVAPKRVQFWTPILLFKNTGIVQDWAIKLSLAMTHDQDIVSNMLVQRLFQDYQNSVHRCHFFLHIGFLRVFNELRISPSSIKVKLSTSTLRSPLVHPAHAILHCKLSAHWETCCKNRKTFVHQRTCLAYTKCVPAR